MNRFRRFALEGHVIQIKAGIAWRSNIQRHAHKPATLQSAEIRQRNVDFLPLGRDALGKVSVQGPAGTGVLVVQRGLVRQLDVEIFPALLPLDPEAQIAIRGGVQIRVLYSRGRV